jgi:hypothetical protein
LATENNLIGVIGKLRLNNTQVQGLNHAWEKNKQFNNVIIQRGLKQKYIKTS